MRYSVVLCCPLRTVWAIALFQLMLMGCSAAISLPVTAPHITIDPEGYPLKDNGQRITEDHEFVAHVTPTLDKVDQCVQQTYKNTQRAGKLLIFIHGGLNTTAEGLRYVSDMTDGTLLRKTDECVIFLNWDADALSSFWDDLVYVRWGVRQPIVATITAPLTFSARLINGLMTSPISFGFNVNSAKYNTLFEEPFYEDSSSWMRRLLNTGESILTLPLHVTSLPFWTGLGGGVWDMLKRRIDRMFVVQQFADNHRRKGAARLFLEVLSKQMPRTGFWRTKAGNDVALDITLVGHSMGAIVTNRIVREFPDIRFKRIIHLGSASSIEDFRASVIPHLARYKDSHFYSFSLAVTNENRERNFFGPPGSLLVWIDNIYEPGISLEKKRIGWWSNLDPRAPVKDDGVEELFISEKDVCSRVTFLKFSGKNIDMEPTNHGELNDSGALQLTLRAAVPKNGKTYDDNVCVDCIRLQLRCQ